MGRTGFGWFRVVSAGFGWFRLVPLFSNYLVNIEVDLGLFCIVNAGKYKQVIILTGTDISSRKGIRS